MVSPPRGRRSTAACGQKRPLNPAAHDRFARPDVAELTIELATHGSSDDANVARRLARECGHGPVPLSRDPSCPQAAKWLGFAALAVMAALRRERQCHELARLVVGVLLFREAGL